MRSARWRATRWHAAWPVASVTFPWTTLAVNLLGSVALGIILTAIAGDAAGTTGRARFAAIGFCGGFTTFSTWMVETVLLARDGDAALGALYVIVSLVAGFAAVAAGVLGARVVLHRQPPSFDPASED